MLTQRALNADLYALQPINVPDIYCDRSNSNSGTVPLIYLSRGIRILLTLAFVGAETAKLAGVDVMVTSFDQIGFGQGFRYLTGMIEVAGAVLLWVPRKYVIGAALLGATMVGAVMTHWFILGPSALPAVILGPLCTAVLYIHRDQIPAILGRATPNV
jgi:putative oxidoreductase